MLSMFKSNIYNIVLSLVILVVLVFVLFPIEKKISSILHIEIKKHSMVSVLVGLCLIILFKINALGMLLSLLLMSFSLFMFFFGVTSSRKHVYVLALIFLGLTSVMLVIKMETVAEFFSRAFYLLLLLGAFKDVLYEKLFK